MTLPTFTATLTTITKDPETWPPDDATLIAVSDGGTWEITRARFIRLGGALCVGCRWFSLPDPKPCCEDGGGECRGES